MNRQRNRSAVRLSVKIGLFLVSLILVYLYVDLRTVWESLSTLNVSLFLAMIGLATLDRLAMSYKWHHLAKGLSTQLPIWECIKAYYAASIVNYLLPTSLSGDLIRGYWLSRVSGKAKEVFASLLMEKAVGLIATILLCWIGLAYYALRWDAPLRENIVLTLFLVSAGTAVALVLSLSTVLHSRMTQLLSRFRLKRIASGVVKVYTTYLEFRNSKKRLSSNLLLAVAENLLQFSIAYLAAAGLGVSIEIVPFMALMALITFVRRLIAYLDSWGLSESAVVAMFALAGISPSVGLAIVLARHGAIIFASLPGMLLLPGISDFRVVEHA